MAHFPHLFILHILIVLAGGVFPSAGRSLRKPQRPQGSRRPRNSPWVDNKFPHDCSNSRESAPGQGNKVLQTLSARHDSESSAYWRGRSLRDGRTRYFLHLQKTDAHRASLLQRIQQ